MKPRKCLSTQTFFVVATVWRTGGLKLDREYNVAFIRAFGKLWHFAIRFKRISHLAFILSVRRTLFNEVEIDRKNEFRLKFYI